MEYDFLREEMVKNQLEKRDVHNPRVLTAFRKVPRHEFIPVDFRRQAYEDHAIPIGHEQTISQPYMVAIMTQLLDLKGDETVLEIGAGSGYQAAILCELCKKVVTVECVENLAIHTKEILSNMLYGNYEVIKADGSLGYAEEAPYDAIIVTAGAPEVPESLKQQLKDGGRLVIPLGSKHHQILTKITRKGEEFYEESFFGCIFVPLLGEQGWQEQYL